MKEAYYLERLTRDAVLDLQKDKPAIARHIVGYALEEILPDWTILTDIPCFYGNERVCVHYFCFCEDGVKLVEFVHSEQKYDETRYRQVTALCAHIQAHATFALVDALRAQAAGSRLIARKQSLMRAYESMQSLPDLKACEVVWITPDQAPWFSLDETSRCTLRALAQGCMQPVLQSALQTICGAVHP